MTNERLISLLGRALKVSRPANLMNDDSRLFDRARDAYEKYLVEKKKKRVKQCPLHQGKERSL